MEGATATLSASMASRSSVRGEDDSESEPELVMADADAEEFSGSEPDEETDEKRRDLTYHMKKIQQEFADLKDRLYQERVAALDEEIEQLNNGIHQGYLDRVRMLEEQTQDKIRVAELYHKFELDNIEVTYTYEIALADAELAGRKRAVYTRLMEGLQSRKKKLMQVRDHTDQIEAEITDTRMMRQSAKQVSKQRRPSEQKTEKRRKVQLVEWPFIIYQLRDAEIQEDLAAMKRSSKNVRRPQQKVGERDYDVYFDDGKLFYEKRWYERGDQIWVENKDQVHYFGGITAINSGEVWIRRSDGGKTKLYISQLRLGKYTIRPKKD